MTKSARYMKVMFFPISPVSYVSSVSSVSSFWLAYSYVSPLSCTWPGVFLVSYVFPVFLVFPVSLELWQIVRYFSTTALSLVVMVFFLHIDQENFYD